MTLLLIHLEKFTILFDNNTLTLLTIKISILPIFKITPMTNPLHQVFQNLRHLTNFLEYSTHRKSWLNFFGTLSIQTRHKKCLRPISLYSTYCYLSLMNPNPFKEEVNPWFFNWFYPNELRIVSLTTRYDRARIVVNN